MTMEIDCATKSFHESKRGRAMSMFELWPSPPSVENQSISQLSARSVHQSTSQKTCPSKWYADNMPYKMCLDVQAWRAKIALPNEDARIKNMPYRSEIWSMISARRALHWHSVRSLMAPSRLYLYNLTANSVSTTRVCQDSCYWIAWHTFALEAKES